MRRNVWTNGTTAGVSALFLVLLWLLNGTPVAAQTQTQAKPEKKTGQEKGRQEKTEKKSEAKEDTKKNETGKPAPELGRYARYDYILEATWIGRQLFRFHSPYAGPNSLPSRNEAEFSHTYTLFLGARLNPNLEVYVNPELALGRGVGNETGTAGSLNGNLIGQPELRPEPYLARYFVRWRIPLGHSGETASSRTEIGRAPNLIGGQVPANRIVIEVGKFAVTDHFDVNAYANDPRAQFLTDAFSNNLAEDIPQETRGYDLGAMVSLVHPTWAVRFGTFAMPTTAGGPDLAYNWTNAHGEMLEGELHARVLGGKQAPLIARLQAYRNVGDMGNYRDALAAQMLGTPPDITAVRKSGAVKYGFGLNLEQGLADSGATGIFARLGWNDGATESFAFAEADRFLSLGAQLSGARWHRKDDRIGVGIAQSDLSGAHRDYLAAGGLGLTLGDGQLNYGPERLFEAYYSYQFSKPFSLSLDYQFIVHPGYNRDRGPVNLLALRAHLMF